MQQPPTSAATERYARQVSLPGFGPGAQAALAKARVLVIGAGGLGSAVLPALAAAGVGTAAVGAIGIIDDDRVERSNLHRQYIHGSADVGRPKVASAAEALAALNAAVRVTLYEQRLTSATAVALFSDYDLVIDGSDNFPTRYLANDAAAIAGIPLVWGAVLQYGGQASVAWAEKGPNYRDLFPTPPPPGTVPTCAEGGVLPTVCAVIGAIMATETLKILTGIGSPLVGRVTTYDALTGSFREIAYERDPAGTPITGLIDYDLFCGITQAAEAIAPDTITAEDLAGELAAQSGATTTGTAPRPFTLLDVREPWEAGIVSLPNATLVPLGSLGDSIVRGADGAPHLGDLAADSPIVVYCHHGVRSAAALDTLRNAGFTAVRHLEGGIDAWANRVDPSLARY